MNSIECSWGSISYTTLNEEAKGTPIVALHGWIDNGSSFKPLSNHLKYKIICPDVPGHGRSSHLQPGSWYHFVDYVSRIHEFIEKLAIEKFHLMGHSLGGAVASLYTAMFPEKIDSFILIDGLGPIVDTDENARENLHKAIISRYKSEKKTPRTYKDINNAIKATADSREISLENAELIVRHHIEETEEGFRWTYDHKLKYTSPLRMTPGQLKSFVKEISVSTLLITVENGYLVNSPQWPITKQIKNLVVEQVAGPHHFHMERPEESADIIQRFLKS